MRTGLVRYAAALSVIGACAMTAVLADAVRHGDLLAEGDRLMAMPWGRATLLDVYVGLVLFSAWVAWRETRRLVAVAWITAILATGNIGACCYVLRAALTSRGAAEVFWLGERYET